MYRNKTEIFFLPQTDSGKDQTKILEICSKDGENAAQHQKRGTRYSSSIHNPFVETPVKD